MLIKCAPWDLERSLQSQSWPSPFSQSFVALVCQDPLINRLSRSKMLKNVPSEKAPIYLLGSEITVELVENNLIGQYLFGQSESFVILHAEDLRPKIKELIILTAREQVSLFLCFMKDDPQLSQFKGPVFHIEETKFWEMGKLLDFLAKEFDFILTRETKQYIGQTIENTPQGFWQLLNLAKLLYPSKETLEFADIKNVMTPSRLDNFALSSLFAEKKFEKYYEEILSRLGRGQSGGPEASDFDSLRSLFAFMQTHLLKMAEAETLAQKQRPNRYELEIIQQAKKWNKKDILKALRLFGNLEIQSKQRNPFLKEKIRSLKLADL